MFCSKCGSNIPEQSKFCKRCGAAVASKESESTREDQPSTQTQGAELTAAQVKDGGTQPRAKKKQMGFAAAAAIAIALVVVASALQHIDLNAIKSQSPSTAQSAANSPAPDQPAAPANLEEWIAANQSDYCNQLRNAVLRKNLYGVADVAVSVSGNQLSIAIFSEVSSDEPGLLDELCVSILGDIMNDNSAASIAQSVQSIEEKSGVKPVTYHYELRYIDGPIYASYDFNNQGRIK